MYAFSAAGSRLKSCTGNTANLEYPTGIQSPFLQPLSTLCERLCSPRACRIAPSSPPRRPKTPRFYNSRVVALREGQADDLPSVSLSTTIHHCSSVDRSSVGGSRQEEISCTIAGARDRFPPPTVKFTTAARHLGGNPDTSIRSEAKGRTPLRFDAPTIDCNPCALPVRRAVHRLLSVSRGSALHHIRSAVMSVSTRLSSSLLRLDLIAAADAKPGAETRRRLAPSQTPPSQQYTLITTSVIFTGYQPYCILFQRPFRCLIGHCCSAVRLLTADPDPHSLILMTSQSTCSDVTFTDGNRFANAAPAVGSSTISSMSASTGNSPSSHGLQDVIVPDHREDDNRVPTLHLQPIPEPRPRPRSRSPSRSPSPRTPRSRSPRDARSPVEINQLRQPDARPDDFFQQTLDQLTADALK